MSEQDKLTPLDVLKRGGWIKGELKSSQGRCLLGACIGTNKFMSWGEACDEVAAEQFPDRIEAAADGLRPAAAVNDHPATTFADIELIVAKAALKIDEAVA